MNFKNMFQTTLIAISCMVFFALMGCPPMDEDVQKSIIKALSSGGCQGCDGCIPELDEGEGEGWNEGEGEGWNEGEGETWSEGEAEGEGEIGTEGEGESENETTVLLPGDVPLTLVWIPGGTFQMGRNPGEQDSFAAGEAPQHQVTITSGFWLGKYEVTQAQWAAIMGDNPSHFQGGSYGNTNNRPVEMVSWDTITQTFLPALNAAADMTFRLPTEAEWEYACRAGNSTPSTRYYWGDDATYSQIGTYAWYYSNSGNQTHAVRTAGTTGHPNAFGLYDMNGNVWEWCQDWYGDYPSTAVTDPTGSPTGSSRVLRGGSWDDPATNCRSAYRLTYGPSFSNSTFGFRLAM